MKLLHIFAAILPFFFFCLVGIYRTVKHCWSHNDNVVCLANSLRYPATPLLLITPPHSHTVGCQHISHILAMPARGSCASE